MSRTGKEHLLIVFVCVCVCPEADLIIDHVQIEFLVQCVCVCSARTVEKCIWELHWHLQLRGSLIVA